MAELQNPDPLVEAVAKARAESSRRPEYKSPIGTLNLIEGHFYAYSGVHDIGSTETDMLNFPTGSSFLKGIIQMNYAENNGDHFRYRIYFNNQIIQAFIEPSGSSGAPQGNQQFVNIIVPPHTAFRATAQNLGSSSTYDQIASFTGEVIE